MTRGDRVDSTVRFSDRAEDYLRFRPGYPAALAARVMRAANLTPGAHLVDLGCGTGLAAVPFLDAGLRVTGVEPNAAMREAGARMLGDRTGFGIVNGRAEATGLPSGTADAAIAAQAFHWFDADATRSECLRILAPPCPAALIWNQRAFTTPFMREYEALLRDLCPAYGAGSANHIDDAAVEVFFGGARCQRFETANWQLVDLEALRGRLMSSSYAPLPGAGGYETLMDALERLFARRADGGRVSLDYTAVAICGALSR